MLQRAIILWVLSCSMAWGLEAPETAKPYTLVRVKLNREINEKCFIIAVIGGRIKSVDVEATAAGLVFTGPPGEYVLMAPNDQGQTQKTIVIGTPPPPGPGPDVPPDVPPDEPIGPKPGPKPDSEFGSMAYDKWLSLKRPAAEAIKLAKAFQTVADKLEDQADLARNVRHYATEQEAVNALSKEIVASGVAAAGPARAWFEALIPAVKRDARTFPAIQQVTADVALGLRRAGGETE